ncbi:MULTISPECIES: bacteriophage holin [unclassified Legionella]|uniref:bacteriophage holin n=1 Tax=unclassified Legionella TaxID=2622702 RepID=UPI00105625FD|nr:MULTISPECIES: bacteriophage holin [unclassified Legionella]MDI9818984.1 bacteriophage holin [Legionella sp. PL877]
MVKCKLSPVALGLSLGILWGISVFIMGLIASYYAYGQPFVEALGALYIGYAPTILGSFIGGLIAFVDAFISGVILAWLYNFFAGCCGKKG